MIDFCIAGCTFLPTQKRLPACRLMLRHVLLWPCQRRCQAPLHLSGDCDHLPPLCSSPKAGLHRRYHWLRRAVATWPEHSPAHVSVAEAASLQRLVVGKTVGIAVMSAIGPLIGLDEARSRSMATCTSRLESGVSCARCTFTQGSGHG